MTLVLLKSFEVTNNFTGININKLEYEIADAKTRALLFHEDIALYNLIYITETGIVYTYVSAMQDLASAQGILNFKIPEGIEMLIFDSLRYEIGLKFPKSLIAATSDKRDSKYGYVYRMVQGDLSISLGDCCRYLDFSDCDNLNSGIIKNLYVDKLVLNNSLRDGLLYCSTDEWGE